MLEAGVGTGRNLPFYPAGIELTAIDLSEQMLKCAEKRMAQAKCAVSLKLEDATTMATIMANTYHWVISTFMCCVIPNDLQSLVIEQFYRILKPNGHFRLLEIVYSKQKKLRWRQECFAGWVEKIYGARFDRNTLFFLEQHPGIRVVKTQYLQDDTYLLVESMKVE